MIRKNIGFRERNETNYGHEYLVKTMERLGTKKPSVAVEKIFEEHAMMKKELAENNELVEAIYERFKTDLDVLRVRTGFTDKNVRILMELWNGFLFKNDQENYFTTDDVTASPLKAATTKVTKEIAGYRERNLEAKRKKQMVTNE